jgi:hypothetical protein
MCPARDAKKLRGGFVKQCRIKINAKATLKRLDCCCFQQIAERKSSGDAERTSPACCLYRSCVSHVKRLIPTGYSVIASRCAPSSVRPAYINIRLNDFSAPSLSTHYSHTATTGGSKKGKVQVMRSCHAKTQNINASGKREHREQRNAQRRAQRA